MKNYTKNQNAVVTVETSGIYASNYCFRHVIVLALVFVVVTASLGVTKTVHADTLYTTGFERPTFHSGDQLLGLDGWSTAIPPFLNPEAAIITNAAAKSGRQSVEVRGADLNSSPIDSDTNEQITNPYDAVGSYRKPLNNYMVSGNKNLVRVDADLQLKTTQAETDDDFFGITITLRDGDGIALGEVGLFSNKKVQAYGITKVVGEVTPPLFTRKIRFNKWYHITMLLDLANDTTAYFIDDQFIGAIHAPSTSNILNRGAMVVYALPDSGVKARANYTARADNFRISVHSAAPDIDD